MKRILQIIIAIVSVVMSDVSAQTDSNPMDYFGKGQIEPDWADSGRYVGLDVVCKVENGEYRNVFDAKRQILYGVRADGKAVLKNSVSLGGEFAYGYYDRHEQCWGMLTFAQSSPFYLADDQAGDQVSERYKLKGNVLYKALQGALKVAGEFDFLAISTAKQKDIRNKNTYSYYNFKPMLGTHLCQWDIMFGYGYSSVSEQVTLSRFGDNKQIWINAIEGLWFGQRQSYSETLFPIRRYNVERHSGIVNIDGNVGVFLVMAELLGYKGESEISLHVEDGMGGYTEDKGLRGLLNASTNVHSLGIEVNSAICIGYKPLQRREFSGNSYHYVQYGKVRRSERVNNDWSISYQGNSQQIKWGFRIAERRKEERMLLYPLVYEQEVKQWHVGANGAYSQNIRSSILMLSTDIEYVKDDSPKDIMTNMDNLPNGYYCETKVLEAQYSYETSDRIILYPTVSCQIPIKEKSNITLRIGYKSVLTISETDKGQRHALNVGLRLCM